MEVIMGAIPFISIYVIKEIINLLINNTEYEDKVFINNKFLQLIIMLLIVNILVVILSKVKDVLSGIHRELIIKNINTKIALKSISLDISYFDSPNFYNAINNVKRDSRALEAITWQVIDMVRSSFQLILSMILLINLNSLFATIIIIVAVPSLILERRFTRALYKMQIEHAPQERKMAYLIGILLNRDFAKDVRVFNIGKEILERYSRVWSGWFNKRQSLMAKKGVGASILGVLPKTIEVVFLFYVGTSILKGQLTIGDFSLYHGLLSQLTGAITALVALIAIVYDSNLRIDNYHNYMNFESNIKNGYIYKIEKPLNIEFKNVFFKYPNTTNYILKDINFKMESTEKIALVGLNGEGKTTIVKLILRLYDITEGEILINGINIKDYKLDELRKCFSVMFQDFTKYAFTIEENIFISQLENKNDKTSMDNAINRSELKKLVNKFDTGISTYLTREFEQNGKELSGGEWQKIALARTFFRNGSIVILDEPSSSLDPEAEHKIFEKINELCLGKGALFISHRLSNVIMADRILVVNNGKIVEDGTHKQLMSINGKYAYLFKLQAEKYKECS